MHYVDIYFASQEKKWAASIKAISTMLKSWTGLIVLTAHPMGMKSIVEAFYLPSAELHVSASNERGVYVLSKGQNFGCIVRYIPFGGTEEFESIQIHCSHAVSRRVM